MKKLTTLLAIPLLALTFSCNINKYLEGTIKYEFEFPATKYLLNPDSKTNGIKGLAIATYLTTVGEEYYDMKLVEKDSSKVDSILKKFNAGDKIRFKKKQVKESQLGFLHITRQGGEMFDTKKGYWKPKQIEVIKDTK
ncbi:hypothetical protein HOD29_04805 [archaeon]|jgi:hypothetical protein|nr:hypothetical protein [archaeon]